jgi:tetratricopeptide (TPR) repeat protein
MRRLILAFAVLGLMVPAALGQEIPQVTEGGQQVLAVLLQKCIEGGALTSEGNQPESAKLAVADAQKLKALVNEHSAEWTPDLRSALIAAVAQAGAGRQAALAALLREAGEQAKDDLAIGVGLYHEGRVLEAEGKLGEAFARYQSAEERCIAAKSLTWQGACQNRMGTTRMSEKRYDEALVHLEKGLELRRQHGGDEHIDVAHSMNNLGAVLTAVKRFGEARTRHEQALALRRKALGTKHPYVIQSLTNLADTNGQSGDIEGELGALNQKVAAQKELYGDQHEEIVLTLRTIGNAYFRARQHAKAELPFQQALEMRKLLLGEKSVAVAESMVELADVFRIVVRKQEAVALYRSAGDIYQQEAGGDDLRVAITERAIGLTCFQAKDYQEAEAAFQTALTIRRKLRGAQHLDVAESLTDIGLSQEARGKKEEAIEAYAQALEIRKGLLGAEHAEVARTLRAIGNVHYGANRFQEAETRYREALAVRRKIFGDAHADVATVASDIGDCLRRRGEYDQALLQYEEALKIRKQAVGEDHLDVAADLRLIGLTHYSAARYSHAAGFYRQALVIHKKRLGEKDYKVAEGSSELACALASLSQTDEAERLHEEAVAICSSLFEADSIYVANARRNFGWAHSRAKNYERAEALFRQSLDLRKRILGEMDNDVATSLNEVGGALVAMGKNAEGLLRFEEALEIRKTALGAAHLEVAAQLKTIGGYLYGLYRYPEAIQRYEEGLRLRRASLGETHPDATVLIVDIGDCWRMSNEFEKAIERYEEALGLRRKKAGRDDAAVAQCLQHIGDVYYRWQKYGESKRFVEQALSTYQKELGLERREVASCLADLGFIESAQSNYSRSIEFYDQALQIRQKLFGEEHSEVGWNRLHLGDAYYNQSRFDAATEQYQSTLAIGRKLKDTGLIAWALSDLALVERRRGRFSEALALYDEAIALQQKRYGPAHTTVANVMRNRAEVFFAAGQYGKSKEEHQQVLAIRKVELGETHKDVAASLVDLGEVARGQHNFAEALTFFQEALGIQEKHHGSDSAGVSNVLRMIGHVYWDQRQIPEALKHYEQALEIREKLYGATHPRVADLLFDIGDVHRKHAKTDLALDFYRRCVAMRRATLGDNHVDVAVTLDGMGYAHLDRCEYAEAILCFEQAIAIRRRAYGAESVPVASNMNDLAYVYWSQGNQAAAIAVHQQSLATLSRQGAELGWTHFQIATCYEDLGENGKALLHFEKSLEAKIRRYGKDHPEVMHCQLAIAKVLHALGRRTEAFDYYFRNSQDPDEQRFPELSNRIHYSRGRFWEAYGLYASAAEDYRKAIELTRKTSGDRNLAQFRNLHAYAFCLVESRQLDAAKAALEKCLALKREVLGRRHVETARTLFVLARVHHLRDKYQEALALAEEALENLRHEKPPAPAKEDEVGDFVRSPLTSNLLLYRSWVYEQTIMQSQSPADWRRAARSYQLAAAMTDLLRSEVIQTEDSKIQLATENNSGLAGRLRVGMTLYELEGNAAHLEEVFLATEQGTARVFLESLGKARALQSGGVSEELRSQERQIVAQLQSLEMQIQQAAALPLERRDARRLEELLAQQVAADARMKKLVATLETNYPQYAALKYPKPCTLQEARDCLSDNEVALIYVSYSDEAYLVLLEKKSNERALGNGISAYALTTGNHLAELVQILTDQNALAQPRQLASARAEAYRELLGPVAERIHGKDLVIVPSGALCYLPFELLAAPTSEPEQKPRFLIEEHGIRYAPSLTALHLTRLWDRTRTQPTRPLWAMGDPIYEGSDPRLEVSGIDSPGTKYKRLEYTDVELRNIAKVLGVDQRELRLAGRATEQVVKQASETGAMSQARYVHFATHGILGFEAGRPQSLVLSQVGNQEQDGFLQVDEVTNLRLNADAVVLSACSSGHGRMHYGEGVRGLARAFLYAGSRCVVCSLWQVEDRATAEIMTAFYGHLQGGLPADMALRKAKRDMMESGHPPLHWAPFVLIGTGSETNK